MVSWHSEKHKVVSRSSTKSEFRAIVLVVCDVTWLLKLLSELQIYLKEVLVDLCNNINAGYLSKYPKFHAKTKHIEINFHFFCKKVIVGEIVVKYTPTK